MLLINCLLYSELRWVIVCLHCFDAVGYWATGRASIHRLQITCSSNSKWINNRWVDWLNKNRLLVFVLWVKWPHIATANHFSTFLPSLSLSLSLSLSDICIIVHGMVVFILFSVYCSSKSLKPYESVSLTTVRLSNKDTTRHCRLPALISCAVSK